jgi:UDP-N-acetylmuramoylalanine--D-glutamate ligase
VDELVARHGAGLRAAVVIGTDRRAIVGALARHAPDVPVVEVGSGDDGPMLPARTADPVSTGPSSGPSIGQAAGPMDRAVRRAAALARPGDVVLLAPAAASMDQFRDYADRGRAFATAVTGLRP